MSKQSGVMRPCGTSIAAPSQDEYGQLGRRCVVIGKGPHLPHAIAHRAFRDWNRTRFFSIVFQPLKFHHLVLARRYRFELIRVRDHVEHVG